MGRSEQHEKLLVADASGEGVLGSDLVVANVDLVSVLFGFEIIPGAPVAASRRLREHQVRERGQR